MDVAPNKLRTPPHSFKSLSLVLFGIGLIAAPPSLHAAPAEFGSAFDKLLLAREHALEETAAPVEEQYRQKLEKLLKDAAESGDVETAVRIKDVIAKIARRQAEPLSKQKVQIVGEWDLENHTDGHKGTINLNADGTFTEEGKRLGVWELTDKQLILHHDNRDGHKDWFNLPIDDGKLDGINTPGHSVTITRKSTPIEVDSAAP